MYLLNPKRWGWDLNFIPGANLFLSKECFEQRDSKIPNKRSKIYMRVFMRINREK
ncbi:hypothetical protein N665_1344s0001 [Sinapis alba]|nr:hypothetical protein N665_1344s0001 [Sinapis alba]